jgi:hypothetical protein
MRFHHRLRRLETTTTTTCSACGAGSDGSFRERPRLEIAPIRLIGEPAPLNIGLTRRCPRCGRPSAVVLTIRPPRELELTG